MVRDACGVKHTLTLILLTASGVAVAHEGHGATPVHTHVGSVPLDVGMITMLVILAAIAVVALRARARR